MIRKLLADNIELESVGRGRRRGYKFLGALTVDRLIGGDTFADAAISAFADMAIRNTSDGGGPNGT